MTKHLSCPNGHRCERRDNHSGSEVSTRLTCPVCGLALDEGSRDITLSGTARTQEERTFDPFATQPPDEPSSRSTAIEQQVETLGMQKELLALPTVPGYDVLSLLGQGGMGVVYKARQLSLKRLVALKTLLAGSQASASLLARFLAEAEAVARLQHPHIVQIYEVGQWEGRPYLALEYVEGGSLAERLRGKPQPPREAAQWVMTLARAVHFAHERGIIHRDLKPANVLVGADGTLKVTDFGLAKHLAGSGDKTRTGEIFGTPSYMAPEQASGVTKLMGPAVDVYALGTILYETLTGRPPFLSENHFETVRQVLTEEPVRPRRLQPGVPSDLETVCLRCLHKEPRKRYATALALAEDLQRFLAGEPIQARPAGTGERLLKWARRRPALAALVVVSSAALLLLAAGVALYDVRLAAFNKRLQEEVQEKEHQRRQAETNLEMGGDAIQELLLTSEDRLALLPQAGEVRRELLEAARQFYQVFLRQEGDNPRLRQLRGWASRQVAFVYQRLGQRAEAENAYAEAIALFGRLHAENPDEPKYRHESARAHNSMGTLLMDTDRPREADEAYRRSRQLFEDLHRDYPDDPTYQQELAMVCNNLGILLNHSHRSREAGEIYQQVLALREDLHRRFPDEAKYQRDLAGSLNNLGAFQKQAGRLDLAVEAFRRALLLSESLPPPYANHPECRQELARTAQNLGSILKSLKRPREAEEAYGRASNVLQSLRASFPGVPVFRQELAYLQRQRGFLLAPESTPEAEAAFRESCGLYERLAADYPDNPNYAYECGVSLNILGQLLNQTGKPAEAENAWRRVVGIAKQLVERYPKVPAYHGQLGGALQCVGNGLLGHRDKLQEAQQLFSKAILHLRTALESDPANALYRHDLRSAYQTLAGLLLVAGKPKLAAEAVEESLKTGADDWQAYHAAASLLASCVDHTAKDEQLSATERGAMMEAHGRRSVQLLREAVQRGFTDRNELRESDTFQSIRARADFQELVQQLAKKEKGPKG